MDIVAKGRRAARLASRKRDKAKRGGRPVSRWASRSRTRRATRADKALSAVNIRLTQAERRAAAALDEVGDSIIREAVSLARELGSLAEAFRALAVA